MQQFKGTSHTIQGGEEAHEGDAASVSSISILTVESFTSATTAVMSTHSSAPDQTIGAQLTSHSSTSTSNGTRSPSDVEIVVDLPPLPATSQQQQTSFLFSTSSSSLDFDQETLSSTSVSSRSSSSGQTPNSKRADKGLQLKANRRRSLQQLRKDRRRYLFTFWYSAGHVRCSYLTLFKWIKFLLSASKYLIPIYIRSQCFTVS
jgi:hypothetical protein